jgi:hypothetical protein
MNEVGKNDSFFFAGSQSCFIQTLSETCTSAGAVATDDAADPAKSVASLSLRNTSQVHVMSEQIACSEGTLAEADQREDEAEERSWSERKIREWQNRALQLRGKRRITGPEADWEFVAGDEVWELWMLPKAKGPPKKANAFSKDTWQNWQGYKLFLNAKAPKHTWYLGWNRVTKSFAKGRDPDLLEKYYPQIKDWIQDVLLGAQAVQPPEVHIRSLKKWNAEKKRQRIKERGYSDAERDRMRARRNYELKKADRQAQKMIPSEPLPSNIEEVIFASLKMFWDMKAPLSIRRQAPRQRFAPAIFAESLGLPEKQIEGWIKRQIAEERIAEEMCCRKMRRRGLKTL